MSSAAPANPAPIVRIGPASDRAALVATMPLAVARIGRLGLSMAQIVVRKPKRQPSAPGRRAYQGTTISSSSNPPRDVRDVLPLPSLEDSHLPNTARSFRLPSNCRRCWIRKTYRDAEKLLSFLLYGTATTRHKKIRSGSPPPFWAAYTPESTFCSL